jgi:hypothetical protein
VQWRVASANPTGPLYYSGVARYKIPAASFYMGACGVSCETDGEWLPVVHREALTGSWRMSNGMVQVSVGEQHIICRWWDGTQWSDAIQFLTWVSLSFSLRHRTYHWNGARVVNVTPGSATVVIDGHEGGLLGTGAAHLSLTIRRGSPWVDCRLTRMNTSLKADVVSVYPNPDALATDATYHIYQTTAVDGWQWVVAGPDDAVTGTSPGYASAEFIGQDLTFGLCAVHSSWTGLRTMSNIYREYYAAQNERTHIGVRL